MSLVVDRLSAGEGARWRNIRLRALRDAPYAFGTSAEEASTWPEERWEQQVREIATFVAVSCGADVGVVRGIAHPDVQAAREVIGMWVAPEARRRHVGSALIRVVAEWASVDGADTLVLDVVDRNADAISFYAARGFERFDGDAFGVLAPGELRMVCSIAPHVSTPPIELHTERLLLRPFRATDVADALAYRNDAEFARYLPHIPQPFTREDAEAFVALNMSEPWDRSPTFAVVFGGRVIGTVSFEVDAEKREAMLGYAIGRSWWGQGIAAEAARAAVAWAIEAFDLVRVWASTDPENVRSMRVMEKLGMARELDTPREDDDDRDEPVFSMSTCRPIA